MLNKRILKEKAPIEKRRWLRLTRACNNRCVFCLDKEAQDGSCVDLRKINNDLIEGRKEGVSRVVLSGGEPTLHPHFIEIIRLAKKLGYRHIQVITNGRVFAYDDFLVSAIKAGLNELTFSIHGHEESLHDKQTRVKGSFRQAMAGLLNALKTPNLIVNVDIVISKFNVKYLADILGFFIKLGVSEFDLLQVMPFGEAWNNKERLFYDIDESLVYLKKAFKLSEHPNLHIWTNRFPAKYLKGYEDLIQDPVKLYDEISGRREIFDKFINKGKKIDCMGERCRFCFLEEFCKDLTELKIKGRIAPKSPPFCLSGNKQLRHIDKFQGYVLSRRKGSIFTFLDFYIRHRYFVKGLICNSCKLNQNCQGKHIKHVRRFGFKRFKKN